MEETIRIHRGLWLSTAAGTWLLASDAEDRITVLSREEVAKHFPGGRIPPELDDLPKVEG